MELQDIAYIRLIHQQLLEIKIKSAKELVGWMGAMQAQDFIMAKWAFGVRLPHSTDIMIESSIDNGEIIRTHVMRPTWHFVSADDIYWMLDLTAPNIRATMKSRDKELELSEGIYAKSNSIIEKALSGGIYLSREEIVKELDSASIATDNNRASHLLMRAELDGLVCNGPSKGLKRTYALLSERVPKKKSITRDEALAQLAQKYFTSHCPATLQDFVWWSGLSVSESKKALEMVKAQFVSEVIGTQTYWLTSSFVVSELSSDVIHVLPAYDEFIISYKDRSPSMVFENSKKVVSNNGIFRPVIMLNGQVIGVWRRTTSKDAVMIETTLFDTFNSEMKKMIEDAFLKFKQFLGKKIEIVHR